MKWNKLNKWNKWKRTFLRSLPRFGIYLLFYGQIINLIVRTPLLSVCSEGEHEKIQNLLQSGGLGLSLYSKTKDGLDVWFWAEYYKFGWPNSYAMRDILQQFETEQKRYWTELTTKVSKDTKLEKTLLLQEIRDMLYVTKEI